MTKHAGNIAGKWEMGMGQTWPLPKHMKSNGWRWDLPLEPAQSHHDEDMDKLFTT